MKYKVIVFDWDGTLCDSITHVVNTIHSSLTKMQLPLPTPEAIKQTIGLNVVTAMLDLVPELTADRLDELENHFQAYQRDNSNSKPSLFTGAETMLQTLKNQGYSLAIATGSPRFVLDAELKRLQVAAFFDISRCANETQAKPHPQMLNEMIAELGVEKQEVLMIGDTAHDLTLAKNAGVDGLGVTYGAHGSELLNKCEPIGLLNDLADLPNYLMRAQNHLFLK